MAAIAGVDLALDRRASGAAFRLSAAPRTGALLRVGADAEIEFVPSQPLMLARSRRRGRSIDEQLPLLMDNASKGLDVAALSGLGARFLVDSGTDHLTWRKGPKDRVTMRLQISEWSGLRPRPAALGTASDRPNALEWDESLRYFRLSQTTDDLFDAFRNLFLALESILSLKTPQKDSESESKWLARAWATAFDRMSQRSSSDAAILSADALGRLKGVRNAVSHAKRDRQAHVPEHAASRTVVSEAVAEIAGVYLALLELDAGLRVLSGGFTDDGTMLLFDGLGSLDAVASLPDGVEIARWSLEQRPNGAARQREWAGGVDVPVGLTRPVTIAIEASMRRPMSAPSLAFSLDLSGIARFDVVAVIGIAPSRVRTLYPA